MLGSFVKKQRSQFCSFSQNNISVLIRSKNVVYNHAPFLFRQIGQRDFSDEVESLLSEGQLLIDSNKLEESIKIFDKALLISPFEIRLYHEKGIALFQLGQQEEAIKCFDKVSKYQKNTDIPLYHKAFSLQQLKSYNEAIDIYLQLAEENLNDSFYYIQIAECYEGLEKYQNALEYYETAFKYSVNEDNEYKSILEYSKGICYYNLKDIEKANIFFESSIHYDKYNIRSHKMKGNCCLSLEKINESINSFITVAELDKSDSDNFDTLIKLLQQMKRFEEANKYKELLGNL